MSSKNLYWFLISWSMMSQCITLKPTQKLEVAWKLSQNQMSIKCMFFSYLIIKHSFIFTPHSLWTGGAIMWNPSVKQGISLRHHSIDIRRHCRSCIELMSDHGIISSFVWVDDSCDYSPCSVLSLRFIAQYFNESGNNMNLIAFKENVPLVPT